MKPDRPALPAASQLLSRTALGIAAQSWQFDLDERTHYDCTELTPDEPPRLIAQDGETTYSLAMQRSTGES